MNRNSKRKFTIMDFPERGMTSGLFSGDDEQKVAEKVFNKLAKVYNFYDNLGGTKYLVFTLQDINNKKVFPFIGTIIFLKNPIEVDLKKKKIKITHRNIVAPYDNNMREVFENNLS